MVRLAPLILSLILRGTRLIPLLTTNMRLSAWSWMEAGASCLFSTYIYFFLFLYEADSSLLNSKRGSRLSPFSGLIIFFLTIQF